MVKIIGGKKFEAIASADAENNSIFLDNTDNLIKIKDNTGSIIDVGGSGDFDEKFHTNLIITQINQVIDRNVLRNNNKISPFIEAYSFAEGRLGTVNTTETTAIHEENEITITEGSDNWIIPAGVSRVDVLVVGGGGRAGTGSDNGMRNGGGGGAGGLVLVENFDVSGYAEGVPYTIGVGGGTGGPAGNNGGSSSFGTLNALGGGAGGGANANGQPGGSGGGAGSWGTSQFYGGASTQPSPGFGNPGGDSSGSHPGGGGGAGGPGISSGGPGLDIWGVNYAQGGGINNSGNSARPNRGDGGRALNYYTGHAGLPGSDGIIVIKPHAEFMYSCDGAEALVVHNIPVGTFKNTPSKALAVCKIKNWEDGNSLQFKLKNDTEDTGWLDFNIDGDVAYGKLNEFTQFTSEPEEFIVRLIPKTTDPTPGYPGITGVGVELL